MTISLPRAPRATSFPGTPFAVLGQVEIADATAIFLAADLLLVDQQAIAQEDALRDGAVRGRHQELGGMNEHDRNPVLPRARLDNRVVTLGAEHPAGGADQELRPTGAEAADDVG